MQNLETDYQYVNKQHKRLIWRDLIPKGKWCGSQRSVSV